jgi:hypothetical protein
MQAATVLRRAINSDVKTKPGELERKIFDVFMVNVDVFEVMLDLIWKVHVFSYLLIHENTLD